MYSVPRTIGQPRPGFPGRSCTSDSTDQTVMLARRKQMEEVVKKNEADDQVSTQARHFFFISDDDWDFPTEEVKMHLAELDRQIEAFTSLAPRPRLSLERPK